MKYGRKRKRSKRGSNRAARRSYSVPKAKRKYYVGGYQA